MDTILTIIAQDDTYDAELLLDQAHRARDLREARKSHPRRTWQTSPVPGLDWAGETRDANQGGSL
jgi:hypothetical protein